MRWLPRCSAAFAMCLLISASLAAAEDPKATPEREYPLPLLAVRTALQQLGAYTGGRLPGLQGFIKTERVQKLDEYQRPYYEFKLDLLPVTADRTLVRVKANVSAWYTDPQGGQSGYQTFESSGRLENDLFDRLNEFLTKNKSKLATDPDTVAKQIATIQQQRLEVERHIAELEKQLQTLQAPGTQTNPAEIVSVAKPPVLVFSTPEEHASVLLRAQFEDEFEVLEHHGAWLRVGLDATRSGWVRSSQVKLNVPVSASETVVRAKEPASTGGFTVIREMPSEFTGDWARLKGKQALYIWARPEGSIRDAAVGKKLRFVESVFRERYREVSHSSQNSVDGIVVIFLDQRGGVAAASLDDIAHWADGSLSQVAFLKKCSLDPPGAFENPGSTPRANVP